MARPIKRLQAEPGIIAELWRRSRSTTIGVRDRERAKIILLRLDGLGVEAVGGRLNTTPKRVSVWCVRFAASGFDGLADKPGRGRKPSIPETKVARVITEATRPPQGRSRWSIRSMSRHAGISASSVQRIRSNNDLKPHRVRTFSCRTIRSSRTNSGTWLVSISIRPKRRWCCAAMRRASVRPSNARSSVCRWRPCAPAR